MDDKRIDELIDENNKALNLKKKMESNKEQIYTVLRSLKDEEGL